MTLECSKPRNMQNGLNGSCRRCSVAGKRRGAVQAHGIICAIERSAGIGRLIAVVGEERLVCGKHAKNRMSYESARF